MRHIFSWLIALVLGVLAASCSTEADYITKPTTIHLSVVKQQMTASTSVVLIEPEDDRAYYYTACIPADQFTPGSNIINRNFMMLRMDSAYADYLGWRSRLLSRGEEFIAPFSSHSLKYGVQQVHFTELQPLSDYMVYAFCVNPENFQPMGDLYYTYFKTDSLRRVEISFQLSFEGLTLYVMPSRDDVRYFADVTSTTLIDNNYDGSEVSYMTNLLNQCKKYHLLDYYLYQNAASRDLTHEVEADQWYTLMAAGYDGDFTSDIQTAHCYIDSARVPHLYFDTPDAPYRP